MKLLRDFLQACLYVDTNFANIKTRKGYFCHKKRVGGAYLRVIFAIKREWAGLILIAKMSAFQPQKAGHTFFALSNRNHNIFFLTVSTWYI